LIPDLPDFLRLSDEQIGAERERQARLRADLSARVRLTPAQTEYARGMVLEPELRSEWEHSQEDPGLSGRLAEAVAAQGRFIEAARYATDPAAKGFYAKAAEAVFDNEQCGCDPPIRAVDGGTRIKLPRWRTIKEIYSLPHQKFGYLVECSDCERWVFLTDDPTPTPVTEQEFLKGAPNDLQMLRVR
jgi:hypothetical protein